MYALKQSIYVCFITIPSLNRVLGQSISSEKRWKIRDKTNLFDSMTERQKQCVEFIGNQFRVMEFILTKKKLWYNNEFIIVS